MMRRRQRAVPVCLVVPVMAWALPLSGSAAPDDRAAIVALISELEAANNRGDVERWVGVLASDFVYTPPGAPAVTSRSELAEVARSGLRNRAAIDIEAVEIEVCGSWAYSRNEVSGRITLHSTGEEISISVKELVVYRRSDDGGWRIARLIVNSNS